MRCCHRQTLHFAVTVLHSVCYVYLVNDGQHHRLATIHSTLPHATSNKLSYPKYISRAGRRPLSSKCPSKTKHKKRFLSGKQFSNRWWQNSAASRCLLKLISIEVGVSLLSTLQTAVMSGFRTVHELLENPGWYVPINTVWSTGSHENHFRPRPLLVRYESSIGEISFPHITTIICGEVYPIHYLDAFNVAFSVPVGVGSYCSLGEFLQTTPL